MFRSYLLAVGCIATACAQNVLTLESAMDTARRTHPLLASAPYRMEAVRAAVTQAALRPNPRLTIQTENWHAPYLATDNYAYLSQTLEAPAKRGARIELARAIEHRTALERELTERQVLARVKLAWWSALTAARVRDAAHDTVKNFEQIIEFHRIRVREGAVAEADLLRVELEGNRLGLTANTASLEAERARIDLFRAMGQAQFPDVRLEGVLEAGPPPPSADAERALAERVELKIAQQAREEAVANAGLARAQARPDVDGVFGYKRTAGYNTVIGGVQVNLPLTNRNQGAIAAADAAVKIAATEIAAVEAIIRAEVRTAEREAAMRHAQVSGTFDKLMVQASQSSRIALAAYRDGGADLLRLLDAERVRIDLEALYYRSLGEYRQSLVTLETAMGVNP